jgi:hypothetical protein
MAARLIVERIIVMRVHRIGHLLVVAVVLTAAGALLPTAGVAGGKWMVAPPVPEPPDVTNSVLQDVSVAAPGDVWAVGGAWSTAVHPLAVHWDGQAWAMVSPPELTQETYLTGVDAAGPNDVWAVGNGEPRPGDPAPAAGVVLRFDGTAWKVVPAPALPSGFESELDDIDMRTPQDGWAVGHSVVAGRPSQPLILHWQAGKVTSSPAPALDGAQLTAVSARAADDVWAAGTRPDAAGVATAVVLHWDGASWSQVSVPAPSGTTLDSVAALSVTEVWAGGTTCKSTCVPLVLHRTGSGWRAEATAGGAEVTEVVPFSPTDVWALGFARTATGAEIDHIEHWDGQKFAVDPTTGLDPAPSADPQGEIASATPLAGAAGDPATGALWAVGWTAGPGRVPHAIYRN